MRRSRTGSRDCCKEPYADTFPPWEGPCHTLALHLFVGNLGEAMQYKPSAGIFVGGLAASFGGTVFFMLALQGDSEGAAAAALIGVLVSIGGIVMLCIGAARALAIIDALPAAFRNLDRLQHPQASAPAQQGQFPQPHPQNQGVQQGF